MYVQHLANIIEYSSDAIFMRSLEGIVLTWNPAAERLYGYLASEVVGKQCSFIVPIDKQRELDATVKRLGTDHPTMQYVSEGLRRDGTCIPVSICESPLQDATGAIVGATVISRDLSERLRSEEKIRELQAYGDNRTLVLEMANRVALDILVSRTGLEALKHIAEAARTLAGARYAALGVSNIDGSGLEHFVTVGLSNEIEKAIGARPRGLGVLGLLLNRQEPLRLEDLSSHADSIGYPTNHPKMKSFLGVPIRRGDAILGSLYLTDKLDGTTFTKADEVAVEALGAHAAVAINNLRMLSQQRELVSGLMNAQEEERRAIAYELHDGLTQFVMASHAHLEAFQRANAVGDDERANRELSIGLRFLKESVLETRRLVNGLRLLILDDLGLVGSVEHLLHEEKSRGEWTEVQLIQNLNNCRFDRLKETAAYRVIQEALSNARKHAESKRIQVSVTIHENLDSHQKDLELEIRDWGKGFLVTEKTGDHDHFGLHGMRERMELLGGQLTISSSVGEGTTVRAWLPAIEQT